MYDDDSTVDEDELPIGTDDKGKKKEMIFAELRKGHSFGETSLTDQKPKNATVWCIKNTFVLSIEREHYQAMLKHQADRIHTEKLSFLKMIPLLKHNFSYSQLKRLVT